MAIYGHVWPYYGHDVAIYVLARSRFRRATAATPDFLRAFVRTKGRTCMFEALASAQVHAEVIVKTKFVLVSLEN